ncbi:ADP-ribosyltransferase [Clostridium cellulovorans]|uniref:NAD:arginine ADP-ribosyltransferase ART n=1 Tax=Clostridium cellulovorans (strain ATCC 35296 / DSM 3052 / OCM 3 / 743B) TaxID=573061 RepID=D9SWE1_CLOC7|nr:ADP-ribosyltransferase [Clostridium cellulovorans]ADL53223.1 NAD:arginine ADP-ribosyltransferase ART [Clostridium cellulovorans 743B]
MDNYTKNDEVEFIQSLYDDAEEAQKEIYKEQKKNRDELLQIIANIMLTYMIMDNVMNMTKEEYEKEYAKIFKTIIGLCNAEAEVAVTKTTDILKDTVNKTFDFYSYNAEFKDVEDIINKEYKGKHFSSRVWENEQAVAKKLNQQLDDFLKGKINVNQIQKEIKDTYNNSAYEVKRLVETEVNICEDLAFKQFCRETGVKKVTRNEVLDSKTCSKCAPLNGKIFHLEDAPGSIHALCRGFNTIAADDEEITKNDVQVNDNEKITKVKNDKIIVKNNIEKGNIEKEIQNKNINNSKAKNEPETTIEKNNIKKSSNTNKIPKLNETEKWSLDYYTNDGFRELNKTLREGKKLDSTMNTAVKGLDSSLSKLPDYKGKVYRNLDFSFNKKGMDEFLNNHKEGDIVNYVQYTSTSKADDVFGNKFLGKDSIKLSIKSKSGKDISNYSQHKMEEEVLFGRDSKFIVNSIKNDKLGGVLIEMEEL